MITRKPKQKQVVCIGGGTGLSTLLRGLKNYCEPTAIVTMADSGGHSGLLRDELGVLPPGDVRACLVALVDEDKATLLRDLFNYRFLNGSYAGANVGNLLLAALTDILGDFNKGVEAAHDLLGMKGRVLPVTLESCDLLAELHDGTILFGEKAIDIPRNNGHLPIKRVWLQPKVKANPLVINALQSADVIVFGPGDLYTSILPNLYVEGVREAITKSRAKRVYIANIMTKHGETDNFTVNEFVSLLEAEIGKPFYSVIYNKKHIPARLLEMYKGEQAVPVKVVDAKQSWEGVDVLSVAGDLARHDSKKLAKVVWQTVERKRNA